jgi:hypothetical protein
MRCWASRRHHPFTIGSVIPCEGRCGHDLDLQLDAPFVQRLGDVIAQRTICTSGGIWVPNVEGGREVIEVGKWPKEIDLYSEIPMHA